MKLIRERDVRKAFWQSLYPNGKPKQYRGKSQNDLPNDLRVLFCGFVDTENRCGNISNRLAFKVTLG